MATGNELITRCQNRIIEFKATAAENTRMLDHLNSEREELEGDIESISEDYLLVTKDFNTVASRSPNTYTIKNVLNTSADIGAEDFNKPRYLERVVSDASSTYRRITHLDHIAEKQARRSGLFLGASATSSTGEPRTYLLRDNVINLFPVSDQVYALRLWYIRHLGDIVADAEELDFPRVLLEAMVWGACKRERIFRRDDPKDFIQEYEAARARGLIALEDRLVDGPSQIQYIADSGI